MNISIFYILIYTYIVKAPYITCPPSQLTCSILDRVMWFSLSISPSQEKLLRCSTEPTNSSGQSSDVVSAAVFTCLDSVLMQQKSLG